MLSRREYQAWHLQASEPREYTSDVERKFFETIKNPPEPSKELVEIVRDFGTIVKKAKA